MKDKSEAQLQTAINSPTKRSFDTNRNHKVQNEFASNSYITNSGLKMSETETQIYSHELIRQVMQSSKLKSIFHDINRIQQNKVLFAKPVEVQENEFKFDSIPSKNHIYASSCSAKIKSIQGELAQNHKSYQQKIDNLKNKKRQLSNQRPMSASARIDTRNPKVNITGLVSYNFNSVNARNCLGFNKLNREEKFIKDLQLIDQKRLCSSQRQARILSKTSGRRFIKHAQHQNVIMSDFLSHTDSYLKEVIRRKEESNLIYNEYSKKLNLIKEYMQQQNEFYQDAAHIVNEIDSSNKIQKIKQKPVNKKIDSNDQKFLSNRRMPVQYKPLFVKQFSFIE